MDMILVQKTDKMVLSFGVSSTHISLHRVSKNSKNHEKRFMLLRVGKIVEVVENTLNFHRSLR